MFAGSHDVITSQFSDLTGNIFGATFLSSKYYYYYSFNSLGVMKPAESPPLARKTKKLGLDRVQVKAGLRHVYWTANTKCKNLGQIKQNLNISFRCV